MRRLGQRPDKEFYKGLWWGLIISTLMWLGVVYFIIGGSVCFVGDALSADILV